MPALGPARGFWSRCLTAFNPNVTKDSAEFAATRAEVVISTARRLSRTGADVLKLEFPLDIQYERDQKAWRTACRRLSEASAVPWVLLSAGVDFDQFKPQVEVACECGASGFLAGRAIWKEGAVMAPLERADFLATVAQERLRQLLAIAEAAARPFSEFYAPPAESATWFESYG